MDIIQAIDQKIGEVRTESLDISVGELISLHDNKELVIQPDFQRLFRWSNQQRSRLVESMLLELPIPSIFVIERENGVLELIDGLQRSSSLIQFVNPSALNLSGLVLEGCDLIPELNGLQFDDLPLSIRLRLKRTGIRTVIIKRQSSQFLRYEMFKRLNTGGAKLSEQDIRNVNARMIGDNGVQFYDFISRCANHPPYANAIELLPVTAMETRANEELVLRFFAAKNYRSNFKGSIGDWLDGYMDAILLGQIHFDYDKEFVVFNNLFTCIYNKFGAYAFVKYRGGVPMGGVAPAYYEAVTIGCLASISSLELLAPVEAKAKLSRAVESEAFRSVTGPGANSLPKMERRIGILAETFQ
ncbi:DUF262 domain-containing protein [Pseudomonas syringae]|uniref:DUF262 domain-containing protein n=1 Tax=Pseudomonas syringae TaxID=317 RepID=UPI001D10EB44|nr:DUF262 domain-containing protein [Pseudomonas syringae]